MNTWWTRIVLSLLVFSFLATACGAPDGFPAISPPSPERLLGQTDMAEPSEAAPFSAGPAPAAPPAPAPAPGPGGAAMPSVLDRMIIRTAELRLEVPDLNEAVAEVERITVLVGGMVFSSSFTAGEQRRSATVTLRVPPEQRTFQEVMDRIAAIEDANLVERTIHGEDVTEQFTDLEAQLRNLHSTESRLLALMERATRLEDVLALERELANVRNQIERLEGRKRLLERRADLATVTVTLREVAPDTVPWPGETWNPAETATAAFAALINATQWLLTAIIWLAIWSPLYGVGLFLLWALYRRVQQTRTVA